MTRFSSLNSLTDDPCTAAMAHVNLGNLRSRKEDLNGAKEHYEKAIEIQEAIYGPDFNHLDVAKAHVNIGLVLAQKG
jgi:tetratricopeptide (TPR) repeat protein